MKQALKIIPASAATQIHARSTRPVVPLIVARVNGVYVPAINKNIAPWSIILKIFLALVKDKLWYKVDARYRRITQLPKIAKEPMITPEVRDEAYTRSNTKPVIPPATPRPWVMLFKISSSFLRIEGRSIGRLYDVLILERSGKLEKGG